MYKIKRFILLLSTLSILIHIPTLTFADNNAKMAMEILEGQLLIKGTILATSICIR